MDDFTAKILNALRRLRSEVIWRAGKGPEHVRRRIDYGHLPKGTTLDQYNATIVAVVENPAADVYAYLHGDEAYAAATVPISGSLWLVMTNLEGVMETAFIVDRPGYTEGDNWRWLGKLSDLENK